MGDYRLTAIEEFLKALLADPRCMLVEGNVIHCNKLFVINGIMKWIYNNLLSEDITIDSMRNYLLVINDYLDNKIELSWEEGELLIYKIK